MALDVERLPSIPAKRYFTLGEVCALTGIEPATLREWEDAFVELKPRRVGLQRQVYQHHEIVLLRRLRRLLHDQSFTISGLRQRLRDENSLTSSELRQQLVQVLGTLSGHQR